MDLQQRRTISMDGNVSTSQTQVPTVIDEDWEEWSPEKGSLLKHMVAGSTAGMVEHVSIFPIDTIKTHMQCQRCSHGVDMRPSTALQTARNLMQKDGFFRLWRGVSTMMTGSIPAHAAYFS